VLRQASRAAVIREARSVVEIRGNPGPARQIHVSSHAERVPLIVIEQEKFIGRSEKRETASPVPPTLCTLAGICQVHLASPEQNRRAQRHFPTVHASALEREG